MRLQSLRTINGEVIRAKECRHDVCETCLARWVEAHVSEQRAFGIHCPGVGCRNVLQPQDVDALCASGALSKPNAQRFHELRKQDYSAGTRQLLRELRDGELHRASVALQQLRAGAAVPREEQEALLGVLSREDAHFAQRLRCCPRCFVAIEKSSGCNSFGCICGHHFNFDQAPAACPVLRDRTVLLKVFREMRHGKAFPLAEAHVRARLGDHTVQDQLRAERQARREAQKIAKVMASVGLAEEEARALFSRAAEGDQAAWDLIRRARQG